MLIIDGNNLLHRELSKESKFTGEHSIRMLFMKTATTAMNEEVIWVWDGYNSRNRRQVIFPEYKNHRPEKSEDVYAMFKLFAELLDYSMVTQINVPEWEADDVIYTLAKHYQDQQITVDTNDADYLQIPGVSLPCVTKPCFDYSLIIAYKALCGDRIDNIGGMPRFGDGTWNNLVNHHRQIDRALATGDWEAWQLIPWPNRNRACLIRENFDQCVMFYNIIKMIDVPHDEIIKNIKAGSNEINKAYALMDKYML